MSILGAILLTLAAASGVAAYRRRGDAFFLIVTVLAAIAVLIAAARGALMLSLVSLLDVPLAIVSGAVIAEAVGLPQGVAKFVGVGFRSREWEFDRALQPIVVSLSLGFSEQAPLGEAQTRGHKARLMSLHPPTEEWRGLLNRYVELCDAWLANTPASAGSGQRRLLVQQIDVLEEERRRLRTQYRAEAAAILRESRAARFLRQKPPEPPA